MDDASTRVEIPHCPRLKFICVGVREGAESEEILSWIIFLLQSDSFTNIEEFRLEFVYKWWFYDWIALDAALTRPEMASLRKVHIIIHSKGNGRVFFEDPCQEMKEELPILAARNLLQIDRILDPFDLNRCILSRFHARG